MSNYSRCYSIAQVTLMDIYIPGYTECLNICRIRESRENIDVRKTERICQNECWKHITDKHIKN
jgi:hypothetical protein